jgi:O-methyltransferase domain
MSEQHFADLWALSDLCTPWCVHVAATWRIAVHVAAGRDRIDDIAVAAGSDLYALHRVLTYLVGKGVFRVTTAGRFVLNQAARGFLDPAQRLGLDLAEIGGRMAHAGGTLLRYVRTGSSAYHERLTVVNDWPDREATAILARCAEAARPSGRVVVLGAVVPDGAPSAPSIEMMLVGGKHRTLAEFSELTREAGLEVLAAERQPSGYFVVECRPR